MTPTLRGLPGCEQPRPAPACHAHLTTLLPSVSAPLVPEDCLTCHKPRMVLVEECVSLQAGRPPSGVSVLHVTLISWSCGL